MLSDLLEESKSTDSKNYRGLEHKNESELELDSLSLASLLLVLVVETSLSVSLACDRRRYGRYES
jgi:hypothetical protein